MRSVPPAEIDIDEALVRRLLEEQHRDLAGEPLEPAASGWDNAMFRLGDALAVRLPRRASVVPFLEREQRWLPRLAPSLPLPVPSAVRLGRSGSGYPWPWSVVRWLAGNPAEREALAADQAAALAAFLRALHRPAPADAPENPFRGVPLATRAPALDERWQRVARETELVTRAIRRAWSAALEAPLDSAPTWIHGDLHPGNVLCRGRGGSPGAGGEVVFLDWARARIGSALEDVSAWLQSLATWEPEMHRRHDTLLARYLTARGLAPRLTGELRDLYWLAAASNALAGALGFHLAVLADRPTYDPHAPSARSARGWLRALRQARVRLRSRA